MKIISFNIWIFIDNSERVWEFIKSQNADIVAFQEIIRHFDDSVLNQYKSREHINKIIWKELKYSFFWPQWITDVNIKNGKIYRDYGGFIEQWNEVFSRFPIVHAMNHHYHKHYEYSADRTSFYTDDHSRSVVVVELNIKGKKLQILNLHWTHSRDKKDTDRSIKQSEYI